MFELARKIRAAQRGDEDGASAVEYALLIALIAAIIVVAVFALGSLVKKVFHQTCTSIQTDSSITATCNS